MTPALLPAHRAAVRAETLVSLAINALVPAGIIRAIGVKPPVALIGSPGLLPGLLLGSGLATLLMTLVVTQLVRSRVARAQVPPLALPAVPAVARWLPRRVALRAIAMALVAVVVLVPVWSLVVAAGRLLPFDATQLLLFNLVFGASVGVTMTPPVVLRALADTPRP